MKEHRTMLRLLFFVSLYSLLFVMEADGIRTSWSTALQRIGKNILSRRNPIQILNTGATVSSMYVGSVGIWWRSGIIAAINQLEQGKKEEAMETLNIAIATLTVFDITQATVQPIASKLINQLVKHKGQFPQTFNAMRNYNKALAKRTIVASADDADDIIDGANSLRKRIGEFFDTEVTAFMKNTQGYNDLVKSLQSAKKWAKAVTWLDTISGPLFDSANIAFCSWQLHNAIKDTESPLEAKVLNIASASLGVASGTVGVVSFVAGALATAGSTLAAFAGPVGGIIGCVLGLASIIIDLVNSNNPHVTIKEHLETIQALKIGSLKYLGNNVNLTQSMTSSFSQNVGFDTVYQVNQGNLIVTMRTDAYKTIRGADRDFNVAFNSRTTPGEEDGYLTMGKNRIFDKSKYATLIWRPKGKVPLGYDFYGKVIKPNGNGTTVFASTPMVGEQFWIRGVHIDTRLMNDEAAPDNVIIGEMTGLVESESNIRVKTGAGDDVLQVTGVVCNGWGQGCFQADLGSGVNTLSFQGMNPERLEFPDDVGETFIFTGMRIFLGTTTSIFYKLKESERSNAMPALGIGQILGTSVLYDSPFDDEIWIRETKDFIVKSDSGNNIYIISIHNERDFTHTITDDSRTIGTIYLVAKSQFERKYHKIGNSDVVYNKETQTLVVFMRDPQKRHKHTGRIILKRTKPGDISQIKLFIVEVTGDSKPECPQIKGLHRPGLKCRNPERLDEEFRSREIGSNHRLNYRAYIDDRPVPSVPFLYNLDVDLITQPIPGLCGDFIIVLGNSGREPKVGETKQHTLQLPANSFLVLHDDFMDKWSAYDTLMAYSVLYYIKAKQKLYYELRSSSSRELRGTIEVSIPEAKRIVFGTAGSYQLLFDLKHDDRLAVNLASEYIGLTSRPKDEYKFTEDYVDEGDKPKQIVLGVPAKTPTDKRWKITLGEAKTHEDVTYEGKARGDYAENSLIINDALLQHLTREGNTMSIKFKPDKQIENGWRIIVKEGDQTIHRALVTGANTLAYHDKLVRVNLHDFIHGEKKSFCLHKVLKKTLASIENDINNENNMCI